MALDADKSRMSLQQIVASTETLVTATEGTDNGQPAGR
jgi:hypothetical protein